MSLRKDLVDELDELVGPRGRSQFVEKMLREELSRERARRAWEGVAGILDPKDYPEWATSEQVQRWVRERRSEETQSG